MDFMAEYTYALGTETGMPDEQEEEVDQAEWVIQVDGSSTHSAVGGGVVLIML